METVPLGAPDLASAVKRMESRAQRQKDSLARLRALEPSDPRSAALAGAETWLAALEEVLAAAQRNLRHR